ncbi:adenylate kinase 7-like [Schistocerca cancellata]|uniref:adenylate kinase 7-like n=1 Tax=Schistocerca cancellata TaxID=274614 RepID=UPI0021178BC5|nr:adenylate kinase 7-like [Schistocerca cancellata]
MVPEAFSLTEHMRCSEIALKERIKACSFINEEGYKPGLDKDVSGNSLATLSTCSDSLQQSIGAIRVTDIPGRTNSVVTSNLISIRLLSSLLIFLSVFTAIEKELEAFHEKTPLAFSSMQDIRHFILLSTVMTWALTKPVDPEEPDLPFTENDYRKRKPHPNYKQHIELEHEVVQVGKKFPEKFKTIVIATGVSYGYEEEVLHFLFKMAWHNKPELPVFGSGRNHIPLIHVKDIAILIYLLLEDFPKKRKYILAVEQISSSLKKIVKAVSKGLTTGEYKKVPKEEAFLIPSLTQQIFEMLTVKLKMESSFLSGDSLGMKWHSEPGFVDNIQNVVTEYRNARKLKIYCYIIFVTLFKKEQKSMLPSARSDSLCIATSLVLLALTHKTQDDTFDFKQLFP